MVNDLAAGVERSILVIRGHRVLLDHTLAELYGVPVKVLNQAVRRNAERFPEDFMFQLTADEGERLRSQFVTLDVTGRGQHRKYLPYAFTEQGVAMLARGREQTYQPNWMTKGCGSPWASA